MVLGERLGTQDRMNVVVLHLYYWIIPKWTLLSKPLHIHMHLNPDSTYDKKQRENGINLII